MRKFLDQNFWSHGTHLGYLCPGSQKGADEMFSKLRFPIAIGPSEGPDMLVLFLHAENLKKFPNRRDRDKCVYRLCDINLSNQIPFVEDFHCRT